MTWLRAVVLGAALIAVTIALVRLEGASSGLVVRAANLDGTPVTIRYKADAPPGPAIVIAHGFAGSRQLMAPFAVTLAQNGYVALSFDFLGHGTNRRAMTGDVTREDGATVALLAELERVIEYARALPEADGRVALLGHSMASDIIVRAANTDPEIAATVAVSMFSNEVTGTTPANLLIIVGGYESFLADEALKSLRLAAGPDASLGETHGSLADGTARRAVLAPGVEHVGVLYSQTSLTEATRWLDGVFGQKGSGFVEWRAPWLGLLFTGVLVALWPVSGLLPRVPIAPAPAIGRVRLAGIAVLPPILAALILWPLPTAFLPVIVADYLALHFLVTGFLTALALGWSGVRLPRLADRGTLLAAGVATLGATLVIALPLDAYVTAFMPSLPRAPVILALGVGTLVYTLADEALTRHAASPWWIVPLAKIAFLASLALAIALDLSSLFFLAIIFPVIAGFFLVYGLIGRWIARATNNWAVSGIALGIAFAWSLGVTFPVLAG